MRGGAMACCSSAPPLPPPRSYAPLRRWRGVCNASLVSEIAAAAASESGGGSSIALAALGGGAVVALAAALSAADPEKRRQQQAAAVVGGGATTSTTDDKAVVRNYFNTSGFERWRRIYGDGDDVNSVQRDIRDGHAQTVTKVLDLLDASHGGVKGVTICDAGCGTGSLAIPLAAAGAKVQASDISSAMVSEAKRRAAENLSSDAEIPTFTAQDLESLQGKFHTVVCLDVLIHYPQDKASDMIRHLASLGESRLLISFAPKTWYYSLLKRIGELFPGPSKATRAYLHAEEDVEAALESAGWTVRRRDMTATRFYFSRLLEAVPAHV